MTVAALHIELRPVEADWIELRAWTDRPADYDDRRLKLSEIQPLLEQTERDFNVLLPDPVAMGTALFGWLNGGDGWLEQAIADHRGEALMLALEAKAKLAQLPWETLHDGRSFLVEQDVVPVRWQRENAAQSRSAETEEAEAGPLQILMMATDPEGVEPKLDFEGEEARILEATEDFPLVLRTEETGSLKGLGKRWRSEFQILHLTGHANIREDGTPYFITETETGERHDATAADLAKVLKFRFPELVFLSGCRTGQAGIRGSVTSLSEQLLEAGATAVLGWGRPVTDVGATAAAAKLYEGLAEGLALAEALARVYQELLENNSRDWHLLRLAVRGAMPGALVPEPEDVAWIPPEPVEELFLDASENVRVAGPAEFVGRRRALQRCLRQLQDRRCQGVVLQGLGGVGKSTVAKRLLERLVGYTPLVVYRGLDEAKLLKLLAEQCESEAGHAILNGTLPLKQRLAKFFKSGLNDPKQRFVLVLDDFEANLVEDGEGYRVRTATSGDADDPAGVLRALLEAIVQCRLPHRVIVTSRYEFPVRGAKLHWERLGALRDGDLRKKCSRLESFAQADDLTERAKQIADGNPRLLEWLNQVLADDRTDAEAILSKMAAEEVRFREDILAEALLAQQSEAVRELLRRGLMFELPVPLGVLAELCEDLGEGVGAVEPLVVRAAAVGLLERLQGQAGELVRVPRVLPLVRDWAEAEYGRAAAVLYRVWWEEAEGSSEAQCLEMHRLALAGKAEEIVVQLTEVLSNQWVKKSRYRETVELCTKTSALLEDPYFLHNAAIAHKNLGDVATALSDHESVLRNCQEEDGALKAATLHCMALIYAQQGDVDRAIALYQDSIEIEEKIGCAQGKAPTLRQLGGIYKQQGNLEKALQLFEDSLAIEEQLGNIQGKSEALGWIADLKRQTGQVDEALALYQQCSEIDEKIGNAQGKAATLHCMALIYAQQGDVDRAIALYQDSLEIKEKIGDAQGKAATLSWLGDLIAQQGEVEKGIAYLEESVAILEHLKMPAAKGVRGVLNRMKKQYGIQ